jgi:hypothetical protein
MKTSRILAMLLLCIATGLVIGPARAAASVVVQNDSMWIDSLGLLHVVGEVKNIGDVWVRFVKITGTLRDATNGIVDVVLTYTLLHYVPPNGAAPFNMIEVDTAKSARVASYTLAVEFRETNPIAQQLVILNTADSKNSLGWLEIVGEVQNNAPGPSAYTQVTGTFYDNAGKTVYVGMTYTSPSEIPSGGKNSFKLIVTGDERSSKVATYKITAESDNSQYTSVPETPWPVVVMTAALTVAIVALHRKQTKSACGT